MMKDKWKFYKDAGGKWRWRRTAANGNIVGASTEGYANKSDCKGNAHRNGWSGRILFRKKEEYLLQQKRDGEEQEIQKPAVEIFSEDSIKGSDGIIQLLQAELYTGARIRAKTYKQLRNMMFFIIGLLCVMIVIVIELLIKKTPPVVLSEKSLSELKVMTVAREPKSDEKVIGFGDTHFEFDKSTLSRNAKDLLDKNVESLRNNPTLNVRLAGYTSAKGTEEVNQKMSEERANTVRKYLIARGIAPERITVVGYGRTRPALFEVSPDDGHTMEALANMRVLFEVNVK